MTFVVSHTWQEVPENAGPFEPGLDYIFSVGENGNGKRYVKLPTTNFELALNLARQGLKVFPCGINKAPLTNRGYHDADKDPRKIATWWKNFQDALVGIPCAPNGIFALDVDKKNGVNGQEILDAWIEEFGPLEVGPIQTTPSGGLHLLFRLPKDIKIPNNSNQLAEGLDLRSTGYICSGKGYTWQPGHNWDAPLTDAPDWLLKKIDALNSPKVAPAAQASIPQKEKNGKGNGEKWLLEALAKASPGNRNETGLWLAGQLRDDGISYNEAESLMAQYASRVPGSDYLADEAIASLKSAYQKAPRQPAKSIYLVNQNPDAIPGPDEKILLTDMGNSRRFARDNAGLVKYVSSLGGWLVWTGKKFEIDQTGKIFRLARQTVKSIYREAESSIEQERLAIRAAELATDIDDAATIKAATERLDAAQKRAKRLMNWAQRSQGAPRIQAMLELGESEPEIATRVEAFDENSFLLNAQNGVIDLKTGELLPHDPGFMMTRIAGADYDPEATAPIWEAFLDRIFAGDKELIAFLQRAAGYSLTNETTEQVFFFLYGSGANGKSTFTNAILDVLGDYVMKIRTETLMKRHSESIPEEVAQLAGARFVVAAELAQGQKLNESLVKDLTGGDRLRARLLYKNSFEFTPVAKFWMYGNHKPSISNTDNAIWRRPKLIPFEVFIPQKERDKNLQNKLRAEASGILNWLIQGCLDWQKSGLNCPDKIELATQEYRREEDIMSGFIDDCLIMKPLAESLAKETYQAYRKWAEDSGLRPISKIAFSRAMAEHNFRADTRNNAGLHVYSGFNIRPEYLENDKDAQK